MSQRVYVDTRAYQLQASRNLIQQAMSQLNATRSTMSCGHAEVRTTQLDSMRESNTFQNVRMQDKMETRQTNALQDKLSAVAPDYTVEVLGDWTPQVSNPTAEQFVNIDEAGNQALNWRREHDEGNEGRNLHIRRKGGNALTPLEANQSCDTNHNSRDYCDD